MLPRVYGEPKGLGLTCGSLTTAPQCLMGLSPEVPVLMFYRRVFLWCVQILGFSPLSAFPLATAHSFPKKPIGAGCVVGVAIM